MTSIILLSVLGYTLNLMTLGGLALAVGILVDDATVTIENTHRHIAMGKALKQRSSTAPNRSSCPRSWRCSAYASCSCRCCGSTGAAKYLFTPMAVAVVFAIVASYFLGRSARPGHDSVHAA